MNITLTPIGFVKNNRTEIEDDNWGQITSEIELADHIVAEALDGIETFSHLHIIFYMDKVLDEKAKAQSRHPRNNLELPKLGTYAQRNKNRPNKLGLTIVELIKRRGRIIIVKNLDAINGTAVLDIKPVMKEFQPLTEIKQPNWTKEIMKNYWGN